MYTTTVHPDYQRFLERAAREELGLKLPTVDYRAARSVKRKCYYERAKLRLQGHPNLDKLNDLSIRIVGMEVWLMHRSMMKRPPSTPPPITGEHPIQSGELPSLNFTARGAGIPRPLPIRFNSK